MATARIPISTADIKTCIQKRHSVNKEQEDVWMIRYTKIFSRELVFAVDLMSFVLQENHLQFKNFILPNCLGSPCTSDFNDVMRSFVSLTLKKYEQVSQEMLEKNVDLVQPSYREFKAYVNSIAISIESAVTFKRYAFLIFCVVMAQMCSLGFLYGLSEAPDFGIMLICRVHSSFEMKGLFTQDTWHALKEAASNAILMRTLEALKAGNTSN